MFKFNSIKQLKYSHYFYSGIIIYLDNAKFTGYNVINSAKESVTELM